MKGNCALVSTRPAMQDDSLTLIYLHGLFTIKQN